MGRGGRGVVVVDLWVKRAADAPPPDPAVDRRYRVRAWCPLTQRYRNRHVLEHQLEEAKAWAARTNKRLALGLETTGRLPLEQLASEYLEELKGRRLEGEKHWMEVERILAEVVAAGATDIKAPTFASKVRAWLQSLQAPERALTPETRRKYLGHLKAVTAYAHTAGRVPIDPLKVIRLPRLPKKSKRTLMVDEMRRLVVPGDEPAWLWATIMLYSGLRAQEALKLRWQAVDWGGGRLRVVGKGGKHRAAPMQPELAALLTPRAQLAGFVIAADFRGLSYKNQVRWFKRLLTARQIPTERRSVHGVRHTWAAVMIASGEDRQHVGNLMGHESERTTEGYTRTASEYREAVKGWPRGEFRLAAAPVAADVTEPGNTFDAGANAKASG